VERGGPGPNFKSGEDKKKSQKKRDGSFAKGGKGRRQREVAGAKPSLVGEGGVGETDSDRNFDDESRNKNPKTKKKKKQTREEKEKIRMGQTNLEKRRVSSQNQNETTQEDEAPMITLSGTTRERGHRRQATDWGGRRVRARIKPGLAALTLSSKNRAAKPTGEPSKRRRRKKKRGGRRSLDWTQDH